MCGRYTLRTPLARVAELFELDVDAEFWRSRERPRFNIAPSQEVAAIRLNSQGKRELVPLVWGLVPRWADDPAIGNRMINARGETIAGKPAFRDAFRHRRCLIVADGFYEWQKLEGAKQPYYIRLKQDGPFAFAGLWERWDKRPKPLESCTIITTDANSLLRPLHNRMPVMLSREDCAEWLSSDDAEALEGLLRPYPSEEMVAYPVGTTVNSPRNERPECIAPAKPPKTQGSLFD
jgi:putative SOS response-associated peptidase YedK